MRFLTLLLATIALAFQPLASATPEWQNDCKSLCCEGEASTDHSTCCPCNQVCMTTFGQGLVALLPVHRIVMPPLASELPWCITGDSAPSRTLDPELRPPRA